MSKDSRKDIYIFDNDDNDTYKKELDQYQKYLKSIKKYDPMDEEEYLYLTRELGNIINENKNLSDIEVLELTTKLEKIENTKDYTVELLELTRQIKKITRIEKELPRVSKKENPKKQVFKSLSSTGLLPKINISKQKKEEKKTEVKEEKQNEKTEEIKKEVKKKNTIDESLTFRGLVEKNIKNNPTVEHFETEKIQIIRTTMANRPQPKKKKESKHAKIFWTITFFLSLLVLAILLYRFVKWEIEKSLVDKQIASIYDVVEVDTDVSKGAITDVGDLPPEDEKEEVVTPQPAPTRPNDYWYYMSQSMLNVNFSELTKKNSDTAGWIQVNGTNINYPYVQAKDNDFYLNHSFDKSYNAAGWVFLDYRNDKDEYGRNNILYAHARLDYIMFGSLMWVVEPSWYTNTNNYVIKTSNNKYNALWQVFSVYTIVPESYYIRTKFTDEEYSTFLNTITSRSVYDFNVDTTKEDKVLTLSSCYFENKRVVLHAKLIKLEEK